MISPRDASIGSCVRDFVHVEDVAEADDAAVRRPESSRPAADASNIGRGTGSSVEEVLTLIVEVAGSTGPPRIEGRRAGDAATLVARADAVREHLGWQASRADKDPQEYTREHR